MSTSNADVLREAKKGSAELVILSLLEHTPRHGYDLAARIEEESGGALAYNFASLYATLYKLEERGWNPGTLGGARRTTAPSLLQADGQRHGRARAATR